jgi:hypothetical protein
MSLYRQVNRDAIILRHNFHGILAENGDARRRHRVYMVCWGGQLTVLRPRLAETKGTRLFIIITGG